MNYKQIDFPQENSSNSFFNRVDDDFIEIIENKDISALSTPDKVSNFFENISDIWKMEKIDYKDLTCLLGSNKLTIFDESFDTFQIAELAMQKTLRIEDNTNILIAILKFFYELIQIDQKYIDSLIHASFLEALFDIYESVKNPDCSIEVLKCTSSISKSSIELRDYVFKFFEKIQSDNFREDSAVMCEIFFLISTFMEFEIDEQIFQAISSFLISEEKVTIILPYLKEVNSYDIKNKSGKNFLINYNKYDIEIKRTACEKYAACLSKLSNYINWVPFFEENDLSNLFIEMLLMKDRYIPLYSAYALIPIWENQKIQNPKLILAIVNLLFHEHRSIIRVACCSIKYLILSNEEVFDNLRDLVINRLIELVTNEKCEIKIASFIAMCNFLYHFQENIPYALSKGFLDIILELLELDETYFSIPYALPILEIIFCHEEKYRDTDYFNEFVQKGGVEIISEILLKPDNEQKVIDYAEIFLSKYDNSKDTFTLEDVLE